MAEPYILGIDAGGTRTRCVVAGLDGRVLALAEGAAANVAADRDAAVLAIGGTAQAALQSAGVEGAAVAACAGVAGLSSLDPLHAEALFMAAAPAERLLILPDLHIAWAGGTGGQPGVAVIGGTGSVAYGRNAAGEDHRCGGWGYLIGDEGSAFWIAKKGIEAALRYHDGRAGFTVLADRFAGVAGAPGARPLIQYVYDGDRKTTELAQLARLVSAAANEGDAVARSIVENAGACLAELAATTIRVLGMEQGRVRVATVGGAFRSGGLLVDRFRDELLKSVPHAVVAPPRNVPVAGAVILALNAAGIVVDEPMLDRLDASLRADLG